MLIYNERSGTTTRCKSQKVLPAASDFTRRPSTVSSPVPFTKEGIYVPMIIFMIGRLNKKTIKLTRIGTFISSKILFHHDFFGARLTGALGASGVQAADPPREDADGRPCGERAAWKSACVGWDLPITCAVAGPLSIVCWSVEFGFGDEMTADIPEEGAAGGGSLFMSAIILLIKSPSPSSWGDESRSLISVPAELIFLTYPPIF
jgi:hypothetical protein